MKSATSRSAEIFPFWKTVYIFFVSVSTKLVIFSDFKELQLFQVLFPTLSVWYTHLSDEYFLSIGFCKTFHFFRFWGIANISSYVFHTFCLIYPAQLCKTNNFRFQEIANLSSYIFHTFCLIYPVLWDTHFLVLVSTDFKKLKKNPQNL